MSHHIYTDARDTGFLIEPNKGHALNSVLSSLPHIYCVWISAIDADSGANNLIQIYNRTTSERFMESAFLVPGENWRILILLRHKHACGYCFSDWNDFKPTECVQLKRKHSTICQKSQLQILHRQPFSLQPILNAIFLHTSTNPRRNQDEFVEKKFNFEFRQNENKTHMEC